MSKLQEDVIAWGKEKAKLKPNYTIKEKFLEYNYQVSVWAQ